MLRNVLIPPILCAAAKDGDMDMIRSNLGDLESTYVRDNVSSGDLIYSDSVRVIIWLTQRTMTDAQLCT